MTTDGERNESSPPEDPTSAACQPPGETNTARYQPGQAPDALPANIGPYRVVRSIGRGGMGMVYLGIREDERFKRHVAIKVLRRGLDSDDILKRFDLERQLLGALNHPNIARLYNAGATESGQPYFVLEYIRGQPIHEFCDQRRLTVSERIDLFRQVCAAVQYAHQNLIIHRDLKPGNIIVTSDGVPKLLDFGIAKLINPDMSPVTLDPTQMGPGPMTPEYASPEQVMGAPLTTASDIYSLGVLLYELLTGHRPYHITTRLQSELERIICEEDPELPSTVITRVDEVQPEETETPQMSASAIARLITPETVSRVREGRPDRLRRRLAGDLDNIILMSMRKEPQRRYATAEQFSDDLQRHLDRMPVIARRDTVPYRLKKYLVRNKGPVAAVAIIVLLLAVGVVAMSAAANEARQREAEAVVAKERMHEILESMIELDRRIEVDGALEARRYLIDEIVPDIERLAVDFPDDRAAQELLATSYDHLGTLFGGQVRENYGKSEEALEWHRKAIAIRDKLLESSPNDPALVRANEKSRIFITDIQRSLGETDEALAELQVQLDDLRTKYDENRSDRTAKRDLALVLYRLGKEQKRSGDLRYRDHYRESYRLRLELLDDLPATATDDQRRVARRDVANGHVYLAAALSDEDEDDEALQHQLRALEIREEVLAEAPDAPNLLKKTMLSSMFVADVLRELKRPEAALHHADRSVTLGTERREKSPKDIEASIHLVAARLTLARILIDLGRFDDARDQLLDALELATATTERNPDAVLARRDRGEVLRELGIEASRREEWPEARRHLEDAERTFRRLIDDVPANVFYPVNLADTLEPLAEVYEELGEADEAAAARVELEQLTDTPPTPG